MSKLLVPGINPLAYLGVNPIRPVNMWQYPRNPLPTDFQKYQLMDHWENIKTTSPDYKSVWILVAKNVNGVAQGIWVKIIGNGNGPLVSLTGNTGGAVFGDVNNNINTLGDVTTIIASGNPGTNTITFSTSGTGVMSALQPQINGVNNGAAVSPIAGIVAINNTDLNIVPSNGGTNHLNLNFASSIGVLNNITAGVAGTGSITEFNNQASSAGGLIQFDKQHGPGGAIQSGDFTGSLGWSGYDGTTFISSAAIISQTVGTISAGRVAGDLQFWTHPDSVTGIQQRGNFSKAGVFTVLTPDAPNTSSIIAGADIETQANFVLPATTTNGVNGVLFQNTNPTLHSYTNGGNGNIFVGAFCGSTLATNTSTQNTGLGVNALTDITSGNFNVAIGTGCLRNTTTSTLNTAVGWGALNVVTTGNGENTGIGQSAGTFITTGTYNTMLGTSAGTQYTTENSNIAIGNIGVAGESHVIRIGTTGGGNRQQSKCWIAAIRGVTTDVNDAIPVLIDSTGQLGTTSSSIRYKENVKDLEETGVLNLRPVTFNFVGHRSNNKKSFGLIAEEVVKVIPELVFYKDDQVDGVRYCDLPVLLLKEIQRLNERINKLESVIQVS